MKLGIFDSGLGGLLITRAVHKKMPELDIVYYGDTLHLPYGNRSDEAIYTYTRRSMEFLFSQDCNLIVVACNTASATALRRLQQTWLPDAYPGRNIIGVVVPTLETALEHGYKRLGLIGTNFLVRSNVYQEELQKIDPAIRIHQAATPLLVPLIENDGGKWVEDILRHYLAPLLEKSIECLLLGCTHYPFLKNEIQKIAGDIELISQDEIIPVKLKDYLARHPEYTSKISKNGKVEFFVSDLTDNYLKSAHAIYGEPIEVMKADTHEF